VHRFLRILIPLLILAAGYGVWTWIGKPAPKPVPVREAAAIIRAEVIELKRQDYQITLESQGVVRAHHTTTLTPQVPGKITTLAANFEDGAFFKIDDELVTLDPADFKAALITTEAALARAQAALAQEEARAKQAKLNWEDIGYNEDPSELVLRVPQLKEARANVDAAMGSVDQARRNLDRTRIRAPFDGQVKIRNVGLGQSVGASTNLGELFTTDIAELRLPLAPHQLPFIDLPNSDADRPVDVLLRDALDSSPTANVWKARIVRTEGALDETSRELFTIARLDDPFGLQSSHAPLRIGQPVRAEIAAKTLTNVIVIPRNTLRGVNIIYLVNPDSTLERIKITPVWSNANDLVISTGLEAGQRLVVSRLPYAPDGAKVQVVPAAPPADTAPEVRSRASTEPPRS